MMRTTRCLVLVAIAASIAILASPSSADQPVFADEKMIADVVERYRAFEWKDCRWQRFPDVVGGAVTGPDGRLWIILHLPPLEKDSWYRKHVIPTDLAEKCIREQFAAKRPLLVGLAPVLFERGGRVWFNRTEFRDELFGFDGRSLIRHGTDEAGDNHYFTGSCPGVTGDLVYMISHNFVRREVVDGRPQWVHRKGATRAFPAWHHALRGTPFEETGHPILLPGDPQSGSAVMVALPGAEKSCFSINHGAGRALGRREAGRRLKQAAVDASFAERDILTNCRNYPVDEAPSVYKDFGEVLSSVEKAGLARPVAMLNARFVIKDSE